MHLLTEKNLKKFLKNPRYLTLSQSKYEEELLRLDLYLNDRKLYFCFNEVKTGKKITASEDLKETLEILEKKGYEIMFFDSATEYYQYIIDFLS